MKTKIVTLLEIAIVICSLFLVATLPAIAADQTMQKASASEVTTASEDDFVLGIYGNANEDDAIDMRDLTYVKLIFFGKKPETELADAKYDGKINPLDFVQIKLIIVGKEKELTIIDDTVTDTYPNGKPVTVKKPVKRIIVLHTKGAEILRTLESKDKIVGIPRYLAEPYKKVFFPELSKLPVVGGAKTKDIDIEKVLILNPDIILAYGSYFTKFTTELEDKLKGTDIIIVRLDCYKPETMSSDIIKLGYILDREKEAVEFIDWHEGYLSIINTQVAKLIEDKKQRVYVEVSSDYKTYSKGTGAHQMCTMAGGRNIAADLPAKYPKVEAEWVMKQNPDIIVKVVGTTKASCGYGEDDPSEMKALRTRIMRRPELAKVTAVTDEKVFLVCSGGTWNNPAYFIGLAYLAKWFYPEMFSDVDPKAIHQEYLTKFQGLDYDLDKHGVFVYPEPA